jgi:hypothetical protein
MLASIGDTLFNLDRILVSAFDRMTNLFGLFDRVAYILQMVVPLFIAAAVLFFLWGVKSYITANNGETQVEALHMITNGVILLFAMVTVWGLVNILVATTGIGPVNIPIQNIKL